MSSLDLKWAFVLAFAFNALVVLLFKIIDDFDGINDDKISNKMGGREVKDSSRTP